MLTAEDYTQILTFLNRTQLQGNEAPALVTLIHKLHKAGQAAMKEQVDQGSPLSAVAE